MISLLNFGTISLLTYLLFLLLHLDFENFNKMENNKTIKITKTIKINEVEGLPHMMHAS